MVEITKLGFFIPSAIFAEQKVMSITCVGKCFSYKFFQVKSQKKVWVVGLNTGESKILSFPSINLTYFFFHVFNFEEVITKRNPFLDTFSDKFSFTSPSIVPLKVEDSRICESSEWRKYLRENLFILGDLDLEE